ncbi:hypothetical protein OIU78_000973 [Salix suchowensis]|nr:hypothetical protein OIU78_000973 [Salix suchowensis]
MGRSPCCEKEHTNKGAWTKEEDERLINYIKAHGEGCWRSLPKAAAAELILKLTVHSNPPPPPPPPPQPRLTAPAVRNSNMCTKTSTRFHLEEQNYPFLQVQPELTMSSMIKKENNSNIIKVGGSSTDSAEDSNSSSGVTTELEVYPDHKLVNLELSIGLPSQAPLSSINNLKQAKQHEQEEVATHQLFETSTTTSNDSCFCS